MLSFICSVLVVLNHSSKYCTLHFWLNSTHEGPGIISLVNASFGLANTSSSWGGNRVREELTGVRVEEGVG